MATIYEGDELGPIAADLAAGENIQQELTRSEGAIREARMRAAELSRQADVVEAIYQDGFLRDAAMANQLALSISSGNTDDVAFDAQSLGEHGDSPEAVKEYLSVFVPQDPSREYPFAKLGFPATAVIPYQGNEHHLDRLSSLARLTPYNFSPLFNADVTGPTLVDQKIRTLAELADLETLDPGHAEQVRQTYDMAVALQKEKYPQINFKDPYIVRMVAILPTGYDYFTDFLPQVDMQDESRAFDPYLVVNGALNPSSRYLHSEGFRKYDKVAYNRGGKEAALRLSRPLPGQVAEEQTRTIMPLADHEMNKMAVILFPYDVVRNSRTTPYVGSSAFSSLSCEGLVMKGCDNIGGAMISPGASGWASAAKRQEGFLGERYVPEAEGQPVIYSVRLLTAQRDPDMV